MAMLAFVLLDSAPTLERERVREALTAWGIESTLPFGESSETILSVETKDGTLFIAPMPGPVPNNEADDAAKYSLSRFSTEAKWRPHTEHLVVTTMAKESTVGAMQAFTRAVAGIAQLVNAVGVYWGNGHVAHDADFFVSAAEEDVPLMAWSGVRSARDGNNVSLLSTGLRQFELPELMVRAKADQGNEALAYLFDLGAYIVSRGEALPDGDTVGRTAKEKMRVTYEASPFTATEKIAVVTLPSR
jgi:Domain of unknown function (DUF4261)